LSWISSLAGTLWGATKATVNYQIQETIDYNKSIFTFDRDASNREYVRDLSHYNKYKGEMAAAYQALRHPQK